MRTGTLNLRGKEYMSCFSTRTTIACVDRYGSLEAMYKTLSEAEDKSLKEVMWILAAMLDAGARYAKLEGIENPVPPTYDDLCDLCGSDDLPDLMACITQTVSKGTKREVELAPEKNGEATPAK